MLTAFLSPLARPRIPTHHHLCGLPSVTLEAPATSASGRELVAGSASLSPSGESTRGVWASSAAPASALCFAEAWLMDTLGLAPAPA